MAIVTSDFLAAVLTNFRSTFNREQMAAVRTAIWPRIAMEIGSTTKTETHQWLGSPPAFADVTRVPITFEGLKTYSYSLENLDYGGGFEIEKNTFEDDKLGLIRPKVQELGQEPARHTDALVLALMETNPTAFDGTAFFADTRVLGQSANIDNILTGAYSGSVAEFLTALGLAKAQMRKFQDDHGRPFNTAPNAIMVPPEMEQTAWQALNVSPQGVNTQSPAQPAGDAPFWTAAGYTVFVNPYLTSAVNWYLFRLGGATQPFIFQRRSQPMIGMVTNPLDSYVLQHKKFPVIAEERKTVGVGDPRRAIKIVDS